MWKKSRFLQLALIACACTWTGCFVPPTATLQSARTAERGKVRITPYYESVNQTGEDGEKLANEFGALVGVGVGDHAEIQVRYDRIQLSGEDDGYNFTSLGPKISAANNRVAFVLPMGMYYGEDISSSETFQLHPGVIATLPIEEVAEVSAAARFQFAPNEGVDDWFVVSWGLGISNDVSRWAIMPELGIAWNLSQDDQDPLFNYGMAMVFYTP